MGIAQLQAQCREITAKMRTTVDHNQYQKLGRLWMGLQKRALEIAVLKNPALSGYPEAR